MDSVTIIFLAIFAALLVSLLWRSNRGGDAMIAIAGIIGTAYGYTCLLYTSPSPRDS